ncbi:vesicle-associated membrane protein 712-like isoform X1 [Mastomys coucha]|uniref:vesicle-associated membrane protein 712-like isoform X1 n=1 Tax=Mastomys coucha TaxID=35658 RepID=UPI001261AF6C|nr:vesicle-associated membrane protein 712-like isoform X1 [Mastomys coucha]
MTITYSCVANGRAVLAELALSGGAYQEAAAKVLRQALLKAEPTTIIQIGSYVYHTLFIDGITYLCATDNGLDTIAPSAFLKKVSDIFTRIPWMSQEHFFPSNALATDFQQILAQHMASGVALQIYLTHTFRAAGQNRKIPRNQTKNTAQHWRHFCPSAKSGDISSFSPRTRSEMEYNKNRSSSTLSTVKSRVSDVKSVMLRNIDTVLERETEIVSVLTEEADNPQATAEEFETTRKIPKRTWWKCFKIVITTLAIPLSIIIILLSTHIIPT